MSSKSILFQGFCDGESKFCWMYNNYLTINRKFNWICVIKNSHIHSKQQLMFVNKLQITNKSNYSTISKSRANNSSCIIDVTWNHDANVRNGRLENSNKTATVQTAICWALLTRQHGHNGQDLVGTVVVAACNHHLGQLRVKWKLGHHRTKLSQLSIVVYRSQIIQ